MPTWEFRGSCFVIGDTVSPTSTADNDNWGVAAPWQTHAEAVQLIRRWKQRIWRELAANPTLWGCPEHRLTRHIRYSMEKCALWHYYGVR
jgi:hypothetical protein